MLSTGGTNWADEVEAEEEDALQHRSAPKPVEGVWWAAKVPGRVSPGGRSPQEGSPAQGEPAEAGSGSPEPSDKVGSVADGGETPSTAGPKVSSPSTWQKPLCVAVEDPSPAPTAAPTSPTPGQQVMQLSPEALASLQAALHAGVVETSRHYCAEVVRVSSAWLAGVSERLGAAVVATVMEQLDALVPAVAGALPEGFAASLEAALRKELAPIGAATQQLQQALAAVAGPAPPGAAHAGLPAPAPPPPPPRRAAVRVATGPPPPPPPPGRDHAEREPSGWNARDGAQPRERGANYRDRPSSSASPQPHHEPANHRDQRASAGGSGPGGQRGGDRAGGPRGDRTPPPGSGGLAERDRFGERFFHHDDRDMVEDEDKGQAREGQADKEEGEVRERSSGQPQPPQLSRKVKKGFQTYTPPSRRAGDRPEAAPGGDEAAAAPAAEGA